MSEWSPLGQTILLRLPVLVGDSLLSFFDSMQQYSDKMCFGQPQGDYENIILCIAEKDIEMQNIMKGIYPGLEEISISDLKDADFKLIGEKLLWPSR